MATISTLSSQPASVYPALLSDRDLLDATARVAGNERRSTAELLALLAELDARKLYLGEGYSSLFTYCTQQLHLSESAAYGRIMAARAARRFPILFARLAEGDVTLTTISLLAAHLTDDNHEARLDAVRRIPGDAGPRERGALLSTCADETPPALSGGPVATRPAPAESAATRMAPRPVVAPLAADRYLLRVTIGASTHAKLERARALLRHTIPNGDPALVLDRALTVLVDELERRKAAGCRILRVPSPARRARAAATCRRRSSALSGHATRGDARSSARPAGAARVASSNTTTFCRSRRVARRTRRTLSFAAVRTTPMKPG